jgi:ribosomal protein S6--L-glutamate ligase
MIAESEKSAKTILDLLEDFKKPFVIQEFVPTNQTSDIRVIVAGNKVIAAYKRVAAEQEIRSNIHAGGTRLSHELTKEQEELALKSAEAIGADICGVDILDSKNPSVIEVNLSPAFARLQDITDINVPKKIAQILYLRTKRFKKRMKEKIRKKKKKAVKK